MQFYLQFRIMQATDITSYFEVKVKRGFVQILFGQGVRVIDELHVTVLSVHLTWSLIISLTDLLN